MCSCAYVDTCVCACVPYVVYIFSCLIVFVLCALGSNCVYAPYKRSFTLHYSFYITLQCAPAKAEATHQVAWRQLSSWSLRQARWCCTWCCSCVPQWPACCSVPAGPSWRPSSWPDQSCHTVLTLSTSWQSCGTQWNFQQILEEAAEEDRQIDRETGDREIGDRLTDRWV